MNSMMKHSKLSSRGKRKRGRLSWWGISRRKKLTILNHSTLFNSRVAASSFKSAFESREKFKHTAESRHLLAAACVNAKSCICSEKEYVCLKVIQTTRSHMFQRLQNSQPRVGQYEIFCVIPDGRNWNYQIPSSLFFGWWFWAPKFYRTQEIDWEVNSNQHAETERNKTYEYFVRILILCFS